MEKNLQRDRMLRKVGDLPSKWAVEVYVMRGHRPEARWHRVEHALV